MEKKLQNDRVKLKAFIEATSEIKEQDLDLSLLKFFLGTIKER